MFTVYKHTLFFEFLGFLDDFFGKSLVLGVRVGFGGREGALASALICIYVYMYVYRCLHRSTYI